MIIVALLAIVGYSSVLMRLITLDGPSKTGKTCLGSYLESELIDQGRVRFDSIGDYFRRMAVAVAGEVGYEPDKDEMLKAIQKVIAEDIAFDNSRGWPDLHSTKVNGFVSTVGSTAMVQETKYTWAERATSISKGEGTDLWIVDGRNPRRTLNDQIKSGQINHALDLYMECSAAVSAFRSGISEDVIVQRRAQDADGDDPLLIRPERHLTYPHILDTNYASGVVRLSHRANIGQVPLPIFFDTTELGLDQEDKGRAMMEKSGLTIVRAALEMV